MAVKLVCCNSKGGVAKTTTCVNVAGIMSRDLGYKVLCIDADPQANLTLALGVNAATVVKSLGHVMTGVYHSSECVVTAYPNLDLVPAALSFEGIQPEIDTSGDKRQEQIMRRRLMEIAEEYDYVLIDTASAASNTILTLNSLVFADRAIVPVVPNFLDVTGLGTVTRTIADIRQRGWSQKLEILLIVAQKIRRLKDHGENWTKVSAQFQSLIARTQIKDNTRVAESLSAMKPVCYFDRRCQGYKDYTDLTNEIIERVGRNGNA